MNDRSGHIVVGRVGKPFGVGGDVFVFADPDLEAPIVVGSVLDVDRGDPLVVTGVRDHNSRMVVTFEGVHSREDAEEIRGIVLSRPAEDVGIADGMIWVADLQGRQVVDGASDLVGIVESVTDGHAHDYLVVARPDGGRILVPMVEELLDWAADPIVLTAPPGLVDPDEAW